MNTKNKIQFGIMCNKDLSFPKWQHDAILSLIKNENICCELLIINSEMNSRNFISKIKQLKISTIFWQLYSYYIGRKSEITKRISLIEELSDVERINCIVNKKGKYSEYFKEDDVDFIKKKKLDFILRFEFGIIKGDILNSANYGVWSFHHGDENEYRGGPPGFWEIYDGKKITGSILQKLNEKLDAGVVLKKCFLETKFNYIENRDQIFHESSKWPLQICLELKNNEGFLPKIKESSTKSNIKTAPNNFQFLYFIFKKALLNLARLFRMLFYVDQWNIGVIEKKLNFSKGNFDNVEVKWFPLKSNKVFYADPCSLEGKDGLDIFFEEYPYINRKGVISHSKFLDGNFTQPVTVLKEEFHLSYPYVFEYLGAKYMIPEAHEAGKVLLYEATKYPTEWKMVKVLIEDYAGIDNTILEHGNKLWMFSSNKNDGSSHNLNLFYADDLFSSWIPHPSNPIKTDIRSARSAGKPVIFNDKIYRPSMNYEKKNEGSLTINVIDQIDTNSYRESFHSNILPVESSIFSDKTHHIFSTDNFTVIDGCREIHIFSSKEIIFHQISQIIDKLKRLLGNKHKWKKN